MVSISLTGSDQALRALIERMRKLGRESAVRGLARALAPELQTLSDRPWQRRGDPDGTPWAPRKARYLHPMLEKTGRTRRSLRSRARRNEVVTSVSTPYARFHQTGTRTMAARPFFPGTRLPPAWRARLVATAQRFVKEAVGG